MDFIKRVNKFSFLLTKAAFSETSAQTYNTEATITLWMEDNQCYQVLTCLPVLSLLYSGFVFLSSLGMAFVFFREQTTLCHWVIGRTWEADRGREALSHQGMMLICHWDQACLRSFQVIRASSKWSKKNKIKKRQESFFKAWNILSIKKSLLLFYHLLLTKEQKKKKNLKEILRN